MEDQIIYGISKIDNVFWIIVYAFIFLAAIATIVRLAWYAASAPNKADALVFSIGLVILMIIGIATVPAMMMQGVNYSLAASLGEAQEMKGNMSLWWTTFYDDTDPATPPAPLPSPDPIQPTETAVPAQSPTPSPTWNYPTITPHATQPVTIVTTTPLPTIKPTIDCATWNPSTPPPLPGEPTSCSGGN